MNLAHRLVATRAFRLAWSGASFLAVVSPAFLVFSCLWLVRESPRFDWVLDPSRATWEVWLALGGGAVGTLGGVFDWGYHRWGGVTLTTRERLLEIGGLAGGGLSIFALLAAASVSDRPLVWALPVALAFLATAFAAGYDEFVYHAERCTPFEARVHRIVLAGHGTAFAAWCHWCFLRAHGG